MADITVQNLNKNAETLVTYAVANGGGDTIPNFGSDIELIVKNGGSAITVTLASHINCNQGQDHDLTTASIGTGGEAHFRLSPATRWRNPATGKLDISYSGVTSVTVAAVRHPI